MDEMWWRQGPVWAPDKGGSEGDDQNQDAGDGDQDQDQDQDQDSGTKNMVPQSRLNEVIKERNDLRAQIKKQESQIKKLMDTGKSEQEKLQERLSALESDLQSERYQRMRLQVASRHGIPEDLISRLQGEDEEALEADAELLKEFIKVQDQDEDQGGGPGNPPARRGGRGKTGFSIEGKSAKEIRDAFKEGKLSLTG